MNTAHPTNCETYATLRRHVPNLRTPQLSVIVWLDTTEELLEPIPSDVVLSAARRPRVAGFKRSDSAISMSLTGVDVVP